MLDTIDRVDALNSHERLLLWVAELEPVDRDLLVLVAWEQFSYADAAAALAIPIGTVRSRMHRIRHTLRTHMRLGASLEENHPHE